MVQQAVIIAGGKGARLGTHAATHPKALVEIAGRPLVEHQIIVAQRYGVRRFLFLTGHLGDVLADHLGNGERFGVAITYQREENPLGTAGALKDAEYLLDEEFFAFYGDIVFDLDLNRLVDFHREREALATLVVHPNDHPQDSDVVEVNDDGRITAFHSKQRPLGAILPNLVNAGIYLLSRQSLSSIAKGVFADFGLDVFPRMLSAGAILMAYNTPEYAKDAGTADRLVAVGNDIKSGKVARRNLSHPQMAVFLDRDGVVIEERGDRITFDKVQLLPGVAPALARLDHSDFLALVVTNQPGVAKGFLTESDVAMVHNQIDTMLGEQHCYVHGYFVCPHHPERGFPGERAELKIACDCRKPLPGLLLSAAGRFHVDLGASFMVGDRTVDLAAGHSAGVCTMGVRTGYGCADGLMGVDPDFFCHDLSAAIKLILDHQSFLEPAANLAEQIIAENLDMVAIGGLARAGKSVLARLLRWQLRRRGRVAAICCLDDFLRPEEDRKRLQRVADRYDAKAIVAALTGTSRPAGTTLIVEGVIALHMPEIRERAGRRVYVAIDEALRRGRFLDFYRGRGYNNDEALRLYEGRDTEERAAVTASSNHADAVIKTEAGSP